MRRICVVGLGYIGLPTAIFFADKGYKVHGYDINEQIVSSLQKGHIHIDEPGLIEKYHSVTKDDKLTFSTIPSEADVFMIAVPTPLNGEKKADLIHVKSAIESILPYVNEGNLIIIESTIPPGTIEEIIVPLIRKSGFDPGQNDVYVSYCPERVIPGSILLELNNNDRIAGGYTAEAAEQAAKFFEPNITGDIFKTTAITAEMTKLMENTFRDVNIALANELALISEKLGVEAHEVIKLANKHPRVQIHEPGPGVGGHCIPIDPYFIMEKTNNQTPLIHTARQINEQMPYIIIQKVNELRENYRLEKIAILGLSYKGNVSDIRESSALKIANLLRDEGYFIQAHDPFVQESEVAITIHSLDETLKEADLALVLVDHNKYKHLDSTTFAQMRNKVVFDTKNCMQLDDTITLYKLGKKRYYIDEQVRI